MKIKESLKKYKLVRYLQYFVSKKYNSKFEKIKEYEKILESHHVAFYFFETPIDYLIPNLTKFQRYRSNSWIFDFNNIENNLGELEKIYGKDFDKEYICCTYDGAKVISDNGVKRLVDYKSKYVNIINGNRYTTDVPDSYNSTIHIYGACTVRGTGVEDMHTIASFLQRILNANKNKYRVINHGIGCGSVIDDDFYSIETTVLCPGDIVILLDYVCSSTEYYCKNQGIKYYKTSDFFVDNDKINGIEWFTDSTMHTNKHGNKVIAEGIYSIISKDFVSNKFEKKVFTLRNIDILNKNFENNKDLNKYIKKISNYFVYKDNIGAVVMNCNPFTLGHRYLIEEALKSVDHLFIFVVEENNSYFSFDDRFMLVQKGTSDLDNVTVIPSGNFIISALTFPGYFYKEYDNSAIVDSSLDIDIFGKYIAPALNIKKRFVGEEPVDMITKQYNETMRDRLFLYGIEYVEIKRKRLDNKVISASSVRDYLNKNDIKKIKKLVPNTTYEYLKEKYK